MSYRYNFDIEASHSWQLNSSPVHIPHSAHSDREPSVTWLPDEPALSPPASSQTICSRQPRAKSSPIRETRTLKTGESLKAALKREGIEGRPLQVESGKTSTSDQSRMSRRVRPGGPGFQPVNTLNKNVHSSPSAHTYGKAGRNFMHGGQHIKYTTLVGDNVTAKTTHEFPDDEHQHKRRKTDSKISPSGTANVRIKRITSDRDSSTAVGSSKQRQYAEDSVFGTQESRIVEARFQSSRPSARNWSPPGSITAAISRSTSTEGVEPVLRTTHPDTHTASCEQSIQRIERRVSDPEVRESAPRLNNRRTSLDDMIDLTEIAEVAQPDTNGKDGTGRLKIKREPSIQVLNERAFVSDNPGTKDTRHSVRPTSQSTSRIVSHHFQEKPIEKSQKPDKPFVEYVDETEQKPEQDKHTTNGLKEQPVRYPLSKNAMSSGQNNFVIDVDSDDDHPRSGDRDKGRRSETPGSPRNVPPQQANIFTDLEQYANMPEDADNSVDEIASAGTSKPSQGFLDNTKQFLTKFIPKGHGVNHSVEEGNGQKLVNMVRRKSGSLQPADPVPDSAKLEDNDADELALPVTPPKIANSIPPLVNTDIQPSKLQNLKPLKRRGSVVEQIGAGAAASAQKNILFAKQIDNMTEVRLLYFLEQKKFLIEHKMTVLDDAKGFGFDSIHNVKYGETDGETGSVRLMLRADHKRPQGPRMVDIQCHTWEEAKDFVRFLKEIDESITTTRVSREKMLGLLKHGQSAKARPSRSEIEQAVDKGVEMKLMRQARGKDTYAVTSPTTHVEKRPRMCDNMHARESPLQSKPLVSHGRKSSADSPPLAVNSPKAALDGILEASRPRRTSRKAPGRQYRESSPEPFEVPESRKFSKTTGLGEPWDQPVVYPPTGRNKATVNFDDLRNLDEGDWLNDSIIEFQIRWLFSKYQPRENQVFSFSTHFYSALTDTERGRTINYARVQKWTARDDIFSKDLVIVPVNEDLHWYLMLIVNLPAVRRTLPDAEQAPEVPDPEEQPAEEASAEKGPTADAPLPNTDGLTDAGAPKRLDKDIEMVSEKAAELHLDSRPATADGQKDPSDIESSVSGRTDSTTRRKSKARAPPVRKPKDDQPMIITLDPLGGNRGKTISNLKDYLIAEGLDKRGIIVTKDTFQGANITKGIPTQDNFYDCGVYILAYIDKLMQNPAAFARKLIRKEFDEKEDFGVLDPNQIRADIRTNLMRIAKEQQVERKQQKRERKKQREAAKQTGNVSDRSSPVKGRKEESVRDAEQEALASIPAILSTTKQP